MGLPFPSCWQSDKAPKLSRPLENASFVSFLCCCSIASENNSWSFVEIPESKLARYSISPPNRSRIEQQLFQHLSRLYSLTFQLCERKKTLEKEPMRQSKTEYKFKRNMTRIVGAAKQLSSRASKHSNDRLNERMSGFFPMRLKVKCGRGEQRSIDNQRTSSRRCACACVELRYFNFKVISAWRPFRNLPIHWWVRWKLSHSSHHNCRVQFNPAQTRLNAQTGQNSIKTKMKKMKQKKTNIPLLSGEFESIWLKTVSVIVLNGHFDHYKCRIVERLSTCISVLVIVTLLRVKNPWGNAITDHLASKATYENSIPAKRSKRFHSRHVHGRIDLRHACVMSTPFKCIERTAWEMVQWLDVPEGNAINSKHHKFQGEWIIWPICRKKTKRKNNKKSHKPTISSNLVKTHNSSRALDKTHNSSLGGATKLMQRIFSSNARRKATKRRRNGWRLLGAFDLCTGGR